MDVAHKLTNQEQTAPVKVAFSYGVDNWLQYEPRRAVSHYSIFREQEGRPKPQGAIALHPWIAWMIERYFHHRPLTAYDWGRDIARIKSLEIAPEYSTMMSEDEEVIYFREPEYLPPPAPYYYDLHDWSVIGRMTSLQSLVVKGVYIDDFSFLRSCKTLKRLRLYNTNFSDCRMLSGLTKLKELHLIFCPLAYQEALRKLPVSCCTEAVITLHPDLQVKAVPSFDRKELIDKDIEELLKLDYCCFRTGWDCSLEVAFSADRAAFIKYEYRTDVYCYDNGSGNCEPVTLLTGECPEEWMMCYDKRILRNIVYYFCCTGGRCHLYQNGWRRVLEEK